MPQSAANQPVETEMTELTCPSVRASAAGSIVAAAVAAVARTVRTVRREMEIVRAQRALEDMSDAMLRDIGIDRCQIDAATRFGRGDRGRRPL